MTKSSTHIYFDEYSLLGLFDWRTNFSVELNEQAEDGVVYTQATIAEDVCNGRRGILVEFAGKGRCFVTDMASVKAVKKYIKLALGDGRVDSREARIFRQMAVDLLDGKLDGKYRHIPINNTEYSRTLRRLRVA